MGRRTSHTAVVLTASEAPASVDPPPSGSGSPHGVGFVRPSFPRYSPASSMPPASPPPPPPPADPRTAALVAAIGAVDAAFAEKAARVRCTAGTTAVGVWLCDGTLSVAHVGDSVAYLATGGGALQLLTPPHTLSDPAEAAAVVERGGRVVVMDGVPRVGGVLQVTRALGVTHLRGGVSQVPTHLTRVLEPGDEFIILCSDGVAAAIPPDSLADIIRGARAIVECTPPPAPTASATPLARRESSVSVAAGAGGASAVGGSVLGMGSVASVSLLEKVLHRVGSIAVGGGAVAAGVAGSVASIPDSDDDGASVFAPSHRDIAEAVVAHAANMGATDNLSVVIIFLRHTPNGRTASHVSVASVR